MNSVFIDRIRTLITDDYVKISEVRACIKSLLLFLEEDPENKETLMQTLNGLLKKEEELSVIYKSKKINFIKILNGSLALGGRPSYDTIDRLKENEVTTIVTLLKETEKNVTELGSYIKSKKINWLWFPLSASDLSNDAATKHIIKNIYFDILCRLDQEEKIFIHCAAGVHRTGSFTNGLLRYNGFSKNESKELIKEMRAVTAIEAVKRHWQWSENIIL